MGNTENPWGFHRGKNLWEIHRILVAQTPWIFHGARTMELHSMGLTKTHGNSVVNFHDLHFVEMNSMRVL